MIKWTSQTTFEIDETRFRIDNRGGATASEPDDETFTVVKPASLLERYQALRFGGFRKVLELGVYDGGSFVFFDKLLKPARISAVELKTEPVAALDNYVSDQADRARVHYGVSQANAEALERIVSEDFGGGVDLVVDKASHWYDLTKASFLTLYPRLRRGGLYIIEDWGWSFDASFQGPDAPWQDQKALVSLVYELLEETRLNTSVAELTVTRDMVMIRKPQAGAPAPLFSQQGRRGREPPEL